MSPIYVGSVLLGLGATKARVTQVFAEVAVNVPLSSTARVTQVFAEVVVKP